MIPTAALMYKHNKILMPYKIDMDMKKSLRNRLNPTLFDGFANLQILRTVKYCTQSAERTKETEQTMRQSRYQTKRKCPADSYQENCIAVLQLIIDKTTDVYFINIAFGKIYNRG